MRFSVGRAEMTTSAPAFISVEMVGHRSDRTREHARLPCAIAAKHRCERGKALEQDHVKPDGQVRAAVDDELEAVAKNGGAKRHGPPGRARRVPDLRTRNRM